MCLANGVFEHAQHVGVHSLELGVCYHDAVTEKTRPLTGGAAGRVIYTLQSRVGMWGRNPPRMFAQVRSAV